MFPDSKIAKEYSCARTKTSAIIREMASDKEMSLRNALQNCVFSVAVDGSNDTDSKLYPIVVTYYNSVTSKIDRALLCIPALESDSTGINIGNLVLSNLEALKIPIENCIGLSCDNAPVMLGEKSGVISVLKKANENICAIGCTCHLIDLAAEKGSSCIPFKIDEILVDIYYYMQRSAKRKDRFKELQKLHDTDVRKILKHVCTRWLSVGNCLSRILDQWQPLISFFKGECNTKKKDSSILSLYKIPKKTNENSVNSEILVHSKKLCMTPKASKGNKRKIEELCEEKKSDLCNSSLTREERIFYFLTTDVNKAFCFFLSNVVSVFDKSNKFLQSASSQIHVLRSVLQDLMKNILIRFVKPDVLKNSTEYQDIDYHNSKNQKEDRDLVIGNASLEIVECLLDDGKKVFYSVVKKYFCTVCDYMRLKFPFKNEILLHAKVADLSRINSASFSDLKYFLEKFPVLLKQNVNGMQKSEALDQLQEQFCALQIESELILSLKEENMDKQWGLIGQVKDGLGQKKFEIISKIMLSILVFPHSNADCERIFSQVKKTRTQFRASLSDSMLEKLLMAQDPDKKCFETTFDDNFLKRAKSCTYNSLKSDINVNKE